MFDRELLLKSLRNYKVNKEILIRLNEKLEFLENRQYGLTGRSNDQRNINRVSNRESRILSNLESIDNVKTVILGIKQEISWVDEYFLNLIDERRRLLKDRYISNMSIDQLASKYGYSTSQVWRIANLNTGTKNSFENPKSD